MTEKQPARAATSDGTTTQPSSRGCRDITGISAFTH